MSAKSSGKLSATERLRAMKAQRAEELAGQVDPVAEARSREGKLLDGLGDAADELEWLATNQAWVLLGHETCAAWWAARVKPVADDLGFQPTRELGMRFVELIRAEEAGLPAAQRRSTKELAALVGVSEWAARPSSRSLTRRNHENDDLDRRDIDGEIVPEPDPLTAALTQAITETAAHTSGAVPPASTDSASPVVGGPGDSEQAAESSGTQDSPAADPLSDSSSHAGVPAVGDQNEERDEEEVPCFECSAPLDPRDAADGYYKCLDCDPERLFRAAPDSPAAAATSLPDGDGDPTPEPEQQPGHNSPTGLEAAQPRDDRSETDHQQDAGVSSPAGEAPEVASTDPVEPVELEGGGTAQDPPSSSDPVVIYATVENIIGTSEEIEIPRAEWDAMTPAQRRYAIADFGDTLVSNAGGWGSGIQSGAPDSDLDDVDQPPSSSDPDDEDEPRPIDLVLMTSEALVKLLDHVDVEAAAPLLFPGELENLHQHSEALAAFVAKVSRIRFEALTRTP